MRILVLSWILFCFLSIFNKYVFVLARDYAHIDNPSLRRGYISRYWSEWMPWSTCSRTCGGGVRMRTRVCRIRVNGYVASPNRCLGETVEYEICSRQACPPFEEDFLEYQCSRKNGQIIMGKEIEEWLPYHYGKNPCELQCRDRGSALVYSFGKAMDGTKCLAHDPGQPALCVNGRCMPVDCAGYIGSDNRLDSCGVCRGDNSTCVKHRSTFWGRPRVGDSGDQDHHYDYNEIVGIPEGATRILVTEKSETNFLVLVDHKGSYQINGNWRIQSPGHFIIHGSEFLYNRTWDGYESLSSPGPIRFNIFIFVLGSGDIPTVNYEYWISTSSRSATSPSFLSLDSIKTSEIFNKDILNLEESNHPFNNIIHQNAPTERKPSPITRFQGYRSYYHRNEVHKSVPSWSKRRHGSYKHNVYSPVTDNYISSVKTSTQIAHKLGHLETSSEKYDTKKQYFNSRANFNVTPILSFEVRPTPIPVQIVKKQENVHHLLDEYGRPKSTLTQSRRGHMNVNHSIKGKEAKSLPSGRSQTKKRKISSEETRSSTFVDSNINSRTKPRAKRKRKPGKDECSPCSKPQHQTRNFCTSDFVLRAVVRSSEKQQNSIRYELEVIQSYKNKVPILFREYVWSSDLCRCPKLRTDREYILMGHSSGGKRETKLVVSKNSFVKRYTQKRARTMLKLVRDQKSVCQKFGL
ncbi:ADAMTS-like protein 5, partial [Stegodyphus mimosarum]